MPSVYLLSEGKYSDYTIVGIFSRREDAEAAIAGQDTSVWDPYEITEYELDTLVGQRYGPIHKVLLAEDGTIEQMPHVDQALRHPEKCEMSGTIGTNGRRACMRVDSPISFEHATKVAAEIHQQRLRERAIGLTNA